MKPNSVPFHPLVAQRGADRIRFSEHLTEQSKLETDSIEICADRRRKFRPTMIQWQMKGRVFFEEPLDWNFNGPRKSSDGIFPQNPRSFWILEADLDITHCGWQVWDTGSTSWTRIPITFSKLKKS